ncbi:MAG TPA: aldolase/citrate lyase family protein [Vicinamibacterales bacterium]|nr:aldolase/citrate lyase family protein [Vicinamibacterales bacterium]
MRPRPAVVGGVLALLLGATSMALAADEPQSHVIKLLAEGQPAIGIWTGALNAPRIAKVLATSDADFIVADVEHEIYDFNALHAFLLEVPDFSTRYRTTPRPTPGVLVKLAHRGGWDPRYEISEAMRVGPALGVWIPIVESGAEVAQAVATFHQAEQAGLEGMNVTSQGMHTGVSVLWPQNPEGHAMVVAMIETEEGVRHAEEIISTPGLSAVHVVHLSDADDAMILALCQKYHVIPGIDATPQDVRAKVAAGWRLISLGWDFDMVAKQLGDTIKSVRSAIAGGGGR